VKLERDLEKEERLSDWTMEAVCGSLPNWIKPTTKEEKILKEGLEKTSENQDNMRRISCLAFWYSIGCPPWAGSKPADFISYLKEDSLFCGLSQKCKTSVT
jgi:hypothetical protein